MRIWRDLTKDQEKKFRDWARRNYRIADDINGFWHPVVQDECVKMNTKEYYRSKEEKNVT